MAGTQVSDVGNIIPEVWCGDVLTVLRKAPPLTKYISTDTDFGGAVAQVGTVINVHYPGPIAADTKTAGQDYALAVPADDKLALSLSTLAHVTWMFEDPAAVAVNPKVHQAYIDDSAKALAEAVNTAICALYNSTGGLSGSAPSSCGTGGGGGVLYADVREAAANLDNAKVPDSDRYLFIHPTDIEALRGDSSLASYFAMGDPEAIRTGKVAQLAGFGLVKCPQVATGSVPGAGSRENLAVHKRGMIFASRPHAMADMPGAESYAMSDPESGLAVTVVKQYNILKGGLIVSVRCLYGVSILDDAAVEVVAG